MILCFFLIGLLIKAQKIPIRIPNEIAAKITNPSAPERVTGKGHNSIVTSLRFTTENEIAIKIRSAMSKFLRGFTDTISL